MQNIIGPKLVKKKKRMTITGQGVKKDKKKTRKAKIMEPLRKYREWKKH